ncbi:phosphoglycerate kinase [Criblamydia sequanensis]|uniref:Phosphoglycerate kinase n=1 Tax=Candidatus Criblamydia sequanensis CRIB-18 TaxID=1437425 RepID=A0A090D2N2_9BACT|nr:phosphoglycerate kinase [Criblamydia sequanensis]CDR34760.1 Phosphoglycerate kinase [Criblamydia sequanensis CRIB-18]
MDGILNLEDVNVRGKKVVMRVDFNVPLDDSGNILDDTRIQETLPSIEHVLNEGGSLILLSHMGRPKGKDSKLSLKPCAKDLEKLIKRKVRFIDDCVSDEALNAAKNLKPKEVLLLENLRFHEGEEKPEKDPGFAKKLAELGDIYVNDAFGSSHRPHASIVPLAGLYKKKAAGFLLEKEVSFLEKALKNPERPYLALIGGAKVSSKLGVIKSLLSHVDGIIIGGGMAYTFLKAYGVKIGSSICEEDLLEEARRTLEEAKAKNVPIYLPEDSIIVDHLSNDAQKKVAPNSVGIPDGMMGVDIGPKTIQHFTSLISRAKTIFWNGPFGIFEIASFSLGTFEIAKAVIESAKLSIVGGGDTIAAINSFKLGSKITHMSTGGGASLEFIEKGTLPGLEALKK